MQTRFYWGVGQIPRLAKFMMLCGASAAQEVQRVGGFTQRLINNISWWGWTGLRSLEIPDPAGPLAGRAELSSCSHSSSRAWGAWDQHGGELTGMWDVGSTLLPACWVRAG